MFSEDGVAFATCKFIFTNDERTAQATTQVNFGKRCVVFLFRMHFVVVDRLVGYCTRNDLIQLIPLIISSFEYCMDVYTR